MSNARRARPRPAGVPRPARGDRLLQHGRPRPASRSWPSAPWRWRGWCRRIPTPAWPTPPRRRTPVALDLDDPSEPSDRGTDRPRRRRRGGGAGGRRASPIPKAPRPAGAATEVVLVTSAGFAGSYASAPAIRSPPPRWPARAPGCSGTTTIHSTVHLADLDDPAAIGRSAGERAVPRLNPTPAEDRAAAGGLRPARRRRPARPSGGRDQRRLGGARHHPS